MYSNGGEWADLSFLHPDSSQAETGPFDIYFFMQQRLNVTSMAES